MLIKNINANYNQRYVLTGYGKRGAVIFDDMPLSNGTQELEIPVETFQALKESVPQSQTLPAAGARLGEIVRPDANVRPSPGRYDALAGAGRGWMQEDKPPGM